MPSPGRCESAPTFWEYTEFLQNQHICATRCPWPESILGELLESHSYFSASACLLYLSWLNTQAKFELCPWRDL